MLHRLRFASLRRPLTTAALALFALLPAHALAHSDHDHGQPAKKKPAATAKSHGHSHGHSHGEGHGHSHGPEAGPSPADKKIALHAGRVKKDPRLWPVWAELGGAYVDKARETHDARWLVKAREALDKSLSMQPTYEAHVFYATASNFGHRFEEGHAHVQKARLASPVGPSDPLLLMIEVEALIGLGRLDEALAAVESPSAMEHFLVVSSRAQVYRALKRWDDALATLAKARELASKGKDKTLTTWTVVTSANVLVAAGRLPEARAQLDEAAKIDPHNHDLPLAEAKLLTAEGKHARALRIYEGLLRAHAEPALAHFAFLSAKSLGWNKASDGYFAAAEKGYREQLGLGEIHTLGALAQLYLDAGVHPDQARELAEENWKYKRDEDARTTLEQARKTLASR